MASAGSGSSGAASSSYGSSAKGGYAGSAKGGYTNSATGGYAGKGRGGYGTAKGLYGKVGGIYDGIGTGYGKSKGLYSRLGSYAPQLKSSYLGKSRLGESYLKKVDSLLGVKDKDYLKQILQGFNSEKLKYFCEPDIYRHRISLDKRLKSCPFCGGDSLVCGCRN